MATVLKLFFHFLRGLRLSKGWGFIRQSFRRWTLVLAFLGRKLGVWCQRNHGKRGTFRRAEQTEHLFPGTGAHLHLKEYVIDASYAPASASHPSLQDASSATTTPPATSSGTTHPAPANLTVEPRQDRAYLASDFDTGINSNRSSANLSGHSRASDRLSIVRSHSRESLQAPASQQTRSPRAPHRQFGRGPSASPSRERPSRSPSPADRVHQLPRPEIGISNLHPQAQVDSRNSPINPPLVAPHAHAPLSPPNIHRHRRRQSSTSVVVGVVNPSTDSLPLSPSADRPPLTEEPYTIDPSTGSSSPVSNALDASEGPPQHDPTASSSFATSNLDLRPPEGRVLQLINSEQIPRYTKDATVPRERAYYEIPPLTTTFLQYV
ncbi:hypothetical protein BJY52DRAFT_412686 [Lactarius psammicola]|nr:hypothetical protein BJY52DRAFT_412686 [Lactarius psammicola]